MDSLLTFIITSWIILIISYLITATYFFYLRHESSYDEDRRKIMLLIGFVFLFIAISRLIHLTVLFLHGDLFKEELSLEHDLIFQLSPILFYSGVITILYSFERRIGKREHNYLTILLIVIAIIHFLFVYLYMFNPNIELIYLLEYIVSWVWNIIAVIIFAIVALMYLRISFKTAGEVRKKALLIFIGFVCLMLSYMLFGLEDFGVSRELIGLLSAIFGILTIPFLIYGYK